MNQEQNNFNTQGNNGTPNNQPLNNQNFNQGMGFNQQSINLQPQPASNSQQSINQMNVEQPTSQPMNNTFSSGNVSNQNFNNKPPKKINLGLIIGIVVAVAAVGVGIVFGSKLFSNVGNNNNEISNNKQNVTLENYDVDLKEVNFKRVSELYVNQIKGNVIQTIKRSFQINNEFYDTIFLTKEGYLYLLASLGDDLIKIDKKIDLTYIDGFIESDYGSNPLIYGNGLFYNLTENGNLEKVDSKSIIYPIDIKKEDHFLGITKDKKLTAILSCNNYDKNNTSGKCNSKDNWITVKSDMNFSYANANMLLSTDNKLYSSKNIYTGLRFKYEDMKINISDSVLMPILENVTNYYDTSCSSITLIQTSDNKLYMFDQDLILSKSFEPKVVEFNEKLEKIYGSGDNEFLFLTNSKMYLLHTSCENFVSNCKWVTTDLTSDLMEYKDKIRNFGTYYDYGEEYFVLLTNGILYELNVD